MSSEDFMKSMNYTGVVNELSESKAILLDEFRKVYVISNMHPDSQEYQQQFANANSKIEQLQSKTFSIGNDVQSNVEKLNLSLVDLNAGITEERRKNEVLKRKLGIVENKYNSASEMFNEYKEYYNMNYLRNWGLLLSIALCIYAIYIIRIPARTAERVAQNNFDRNTLFTLVIDLFSYIPCLLGNIMLFVGRFLTLIIKAILYVPCLLVGMKIE
jgi:hypothetical protein